MLLRVLGPASGVCLALGPVFPGVAHGVPALIGLGGHIPIRGAPYVCPLSFTVYYIEIWHCGMCLATYDASEEDWWVECDKCSWWYHSMCVRLRRNPGARRWLCPACKRH